MRLQLDGSTAIRAPAQEVFRLLTDVNFLATTLPDAEDVRVIDATHLEAKVKVRIAVVISRLAVKMSITSTEPPSRAALHVDASGSGSTMAIDSVFELVGSSPTTMKWTANAEVGGVMAGLGSGLLKGFATKKVAEIFEAMTKAIETAAG